MTKPNFATSLLSIEPDDNVDGILICFTAEEIAEIEVVAEEATMPATSKLAV